MRRVTFVLVGLVAVVAVAAGAALPARADRGRDHDWICVYLEQLHLGYCQQDPLPERLPSTEDVHQAAESPTTLTDEAVSVVEVAASVAQHVQSQAPAPVPAAPAAPSVPATPAAPSAPTASEVPSVPEVPEVPEVSEVPAVPAVSEVPALPSAPSLPSIPTI